MWRIEYYETENGKTPVYDFINSLPDKLKAKAARDLMLLEECGASLQMPFSKPLKNGLFELRVQYANDISRIFYFFFIGKKIILTNGYIKKQQKVDKAAMELAIKYKADYERRRK